MNQNNIMSVCRTFFTLILACVLSTILFAQTKKIEKKPVPNKVEVEGPVFEIFDVSQKAVFPGGDEGLQRFIAENIKYPVIALKNNTQGTINVMFIVDTKGKVKNGNWKKLRLLAMRIWP